MNNKIKFILPIVLVFTVLYAEKSNLDGVSAEVSLTSYYSGEKDFTGIRFGYIGDYKENTQLYFSIAFATILENKESKELSPLSVPIGIFRRSNFASHNMFLDLGIVGELLTYTKDKKSYHSTSLVPEIGMGVKLPLSKRSKLFLRGSIGFDLLNKKDKDENKYYDRWEDDDEDEDESEEEEETDEEEEDKDWEDWEDKNLYNSNNLVLRLDFGITF